MRKPHPWLVDLAAAADLGQADVGGKAAVLADLSVAGFPVPPALVVRDGVFDDPDMGERLADAARGLGGERFAVRSSSAAEDLPDASYAGLYESYLNVPVDGLSEAVRRCFAAASHDRVDAYRRRFESTPETITHSASSVQTWPSDRPRTFCDTTLASPSCG